MQVYTLHQANTHILKLGLTFDERCVLGPRITLTLDLPLGRKLLTVAVYI